MTWCWWCCHPVEGTELHLPYKYDDRLKRFSTMGSFCSWSCMRSFALSEYTDAQAGILCSYINMMHKKATNTCETVSSAPSKWALKVFGGTLSIEEFRNMSRNKHVTVRMPNETHKLYTVVEINKRETKISTDGELESKFRDIQNATGTNEPLKLKRSKPLKRENENNLEKSLGLKRTSKA